MSRNCIDRSRMAIICKLTTESCSAWVLLRSVIMLASSLRAFIHHFDFSLLTARPFSLDRALQAFDSTSRALLFLILIAVLVYWETWRFRRISFEQIYAAAECRWSKPQRRVRGLAAVVILSFCFLFIALQYYQGHVPPDYTTRELLQFFSRGIVAWFIAFPLIFALNGATSVFLDRWFTRRKILLILSTLLGVGVSAAYFRAHPHPGLIPDLYHSACTGLEWFLGNLLAFI